MDAEIFSGAFAGGLGGLYSDFNEQRKFKHQEKLADMRAEIQQMIAQLNAGQRERTGAGHDETAKVVADTRAGAARDVAETNVGGRVDVANINAGSREKVADANNLASMDRLGRQIRFGTYKHDNASGDAKLGSETTRRGQDVTSATARRGQDITAETGRRGQDLGFSLGTERNAVAERGQDIDFGLGTERNYVARKRGRSIFDVTFDEQSDPAAAAPAAAAPATPPPAAAPKPVLPPRVVRPGGGGAPPAAAARAPIPVTPRAAAPAPTAAAPLQALTAKATVLLSQYQAEQNPAKKRALQAQLADLKKQRDALLASGGK